MYPDLPRAGPVAALLPRHLELLGETLHRLGTQNRSELARTLAQAAAGLVCEAVSAALAAPSPPHRPSWGWGGPTAPLIGTFAPYDRYDDPYGQDDDLDYGWEQYNDWPQPHHDPPELLPTEAWPAALAVGLRLAAWWLGRRSSRLLPALALGAVAAAAGVAGGPLVLAGLCLAETLLGLAAAEGAALLASRLLTRPD